MPRLISAAFTPRRSRVPLVLAVVALCAQLFAATAHAVLSTPTALSAAGDNAAGASVAENGSGEAVATWVVTDSLNYTVQAVVRPSGGSFGTRVSLGQVARPSNDPIADVVANPGVPAVAVAPDGAAVVAWTTYDGVNRQIRATYRPAGGSFGAASTLTSGSGTYGGHYNPVVTALPDGTFLLAWSGADGTQVTTRPAGGSFGAPATLSAAGTSPKFAVDSAGNALAVWQSPGPGSPPKEPVLAAYRPAGGSFAPSTTIGYATSYGAGNVSAGFRPNGEAVIVWRGYQPDTSSSNSGFGKINSSVRSPSNGAYSTPTESVDQYSELYSVAVNDIGEARASARQNYEDSEGYTLGVPTGPSTTRESIAAPPTLIGTSTGFVGAWALRDNANETFSLRVALRPAGGIFGVGRAVDTTSGASTYAPSLAIDNAGAITLVYTRELADGSRSVQVVSGTAEQSPADTIRPSVAIANPTQGQHFALGQNAQSEFTCTDGESGIKSCTAPAQIDTSTVGSHTFTATAVDNAGNSTAVAVTYLVDEPNGNPPAGDPAPTVTGGPTQQATPGPASTPLPLSGTAKPAGDTTPPSLNQVKVPSKVIASKAGALKLDLGKATEDLSVNVVLTKGGTKAARAAKTTKLGKASVKVKKGGRIKVAVKLSKAARRLLATGKTVRATLALTLTDGAGNRSKRSYKLQLHRAQ